MPQHSKNGKLDMANSGDRTPSHLIFATDFSVRGDRAQDRAIQLALQWNASLTAVHAIEDMDIRGDSRPGQNRESMAHRHAEILREELATTGLRATVAVEHGKSTDVVLDVTARERGEMIVTGIAGNSALGQSILGSTVTELARLSTVPVLVVKKRVTETDDRVVVASDLSEASLPALQMALRSFPPERLTFFHAFDMPYRGWTDDKAGYENQARAAAIEECRRVLAAAAGQAVAASIKIETFCGDAARGLGNYAAAENIDLIIAGTRGHGGVTQFLLGSVSARILNEAHCDVLIVPRGE